MSGNSRWQRSRKGLMAAAGSLIIGVGTVLAAGLDGQSAPDFSLQNSAGEQVSLSDLRGDVVMINVWATWCGPCRVIAPTIEKLAADFDGKVKVGKVDTDAITAWVSASSGLTSMMIRDVRKR